MKGVCPVMDRNLSRVESCFLKAGLFDTNQVKVYLAENEWIQNQTDKKKWTKSRQQILACKNAECK